MDVLDKYEEDALNHKVYLIVNEKKYLIRYLLRYLKRGLTLQELGFSEIN